MRAIECPNCYARVILTEEKKCPACNKDPESPDADPTRSKITIWEGQLLPALCFVCGDQTDLTIIVRKTSSTMASEIFQTVFNIAIIPLKFLTFGVFGLLVNTTMRNRTFKTLKFIIPLCSKCRANQIPKTEWADFEGKRSTEPHYPAAAVWA